MEHLSAQHAETVAYIRRHAARTGGLPEVHRAAYAKLLRAQRQAWIEAGGAAADFAGADLLGELAQADQPSAPPRSRTRKRRG